MVEKVSEYEEGSYRYRPLEHALTPHLQDAKKRVEMIFADNVLPRYSQGDDSVTTLISIGYVLLASALADTRSPTELAAITGFQEDFPEAILSVMDEYEMWLLDWSHSLKFVAQKERPSPQEMMRAFNDATAGFYEVEWPSEYFARFEITRARIVGGGERQNYIDQSFFDSFVRRR